jgi:hypothetical protein
VKSILKDVLCVWKTCGESDEASAKKYRSEIEGSVRSCHFAQVSKEGDGEAEGMGLRCG